MKIENMDRHILTYSSVEDYKLCTKRFWAVRNA